MSETVNARSTVRDFDFWMGSWTGHNRRLRERLAGSDEWEEFESTSNAWPILDGMGNEDDFHTGFEGGFAVTHTVHLVASHGAWKWILPSWRFRDYKADRCPTDAGSSPPPSQS